MHREWTSGLLCYLKQFFLWLPVSYFWVTGSRKPFRALKEPKFIQCSHVQKFTHTQHLWVRRLLTSSLYWHEKCIWNKQQYPCIHFEYTCINMKIEWIHTGFETEYVLRNQYSWKSCHVIRRAVATIEDMYLLYYLGWLRYFLTQCYTRMLFKLGIKMVILIYRSILYHLISNYLEGTLQSKGK